MKRKMFLSVLVLVTMLLAACAAPTPEIIEKEVVVEKKVVETVEVEKEVVVEKLVVETVIVEKEVVLVVTATPEPATATPRKGGTLTMRLGGDITMYDPVINTVSPMKNWIRFMLYNALVRYDRNTEVIPDLAVSWSNPDDTTWIFKLREGVKWHDGSDFTAEDCVDTFERVMDINTGSAWRTQVEPLVERMEAVDKYTFKVVTKAPSASLLQALGSVAITKRGSTKETIGLEPMGTGPFRFVEWVANEHLILERNPDYWRKGYPLLDKVIIKPINDVSVAFTNLKAGGIDFFWDAMPAQAEELRAMPDFVVGDQDSMGGRMIQFNSLEPPFNDVRVRQAAMMCLDKQAVADMVYDGQATPSFTPYPLNHWSTPPDVKDWPYDLEGAKQKLAEAGLKPEDVPFTAIAIAGSAGMEGPAMVWQDSLAKIGWKMEIESFESSIWLEAYWDGDYQVCMQGAYAPPEPVAYYTQLIGEMMAERMHVYENPEMWALIEKADATLDPAERAEVYHEIGRMMVDDLPLGFSVSTKTFWGFNKKVKGVWVNQASTMEGDIIEAYIEE